MKINIGTGFKKYQHQYKSSNNTTAGFGDVQPLLCRMMLPDSSISVKLSQFVRLMPMPYPTLGSIQIKNVAKFVPIGDIFAPFDSLLAGLPFHLDSGDSVIPSKLPWITNKELQVILLSSGYAIWNQYDQSQTSATNGKVNWNPPVKSTDVVNPDFGDVSYLPGVDNVNGTDEQVQYPDVTIDGADYVYEVVRGSVAAIRTYYCFKYTEKGKRFRKLLLGLGYNPSLEDETPVSVLPLFAFYKAYFETFNPQRTLNFQNTTTFSEIENFNDLPYEIDYHGASFFQYISSESNGSAYVKDIVDEWSDCFATENTDWISLHTTDILNKHEGTTPESSNSESVGLGVTTDSANGLPYITQAAETQNGEALTASNLELLRRITSLFTKESVLGNKISKWIDHKYGAEISNQLYAMSNSVGESTTEVQISDVNSMADTMNESSDGKRTGSALGSYAGKGVGYSPNGTFTFKTKKHGYLIIMSYILPQEGYFQGTDPTLFALTNDEMPSPLYDAVGYELTPRSAVWTDNGVSTYDFPNGKFNQYNPLKYTKLDVSTSFGYLPRYSGFKNIKNIVNGDLSRRGVASDMQCFYLDKLFVNRGIAPSKKSTVEPYQNDLPKASEQWRYIMRYPWLQNYNRMFYNWDVNTQNKDNSMVFNNILDDNFIIHNLFDITENNYLKPIRESYDSFINGVNTGSVDVQSV